MKKNKKDKSYFGGSLTYICPSCKTKQTMVRQWQTTSVGYNVDLKTGSFVDNEDPKYSDSSDFEAWACPECDADLPNDLVKKLNL